MRCRRICPRARSHVENVVVLREIEFAGAEHPSDEGLVK